MFDEVMIQSSLFLQNLSLQSKATNIKSHCFYLQYSYLLSEDLLFHQIYFISDTKEGDILVLDQKVQQQCHDMRHTECFYSGAHAEDKSWR